MLCKSTNLCNKIEIKKFIKRRSSTSSVSLYNLSVIVTFLGNDMPTHQKMEILSLYDNIISTI